MASIKNRFLERWPPYALVLAILYALFPGVELLLLLVANHPTHLTKNIPFALLALFLLGFSGFVLFRAKRVDRFMRENADWRFLLEALFLLLWFLLRYIPPQSSVSLFFFSNAVEAIGFLLLVHFLLHADAWKRDFATLFSVTASPVALLLAPFVSTLLFNLAIGEFQGLLPYFGFLPVLYLDEIIMQWLLGLVLIGFTKRIGLFLFMHMGLLALIAIAQAAHISVFSQPIGQDDIKMAWELLLILSWPMRALLLLPVFAVVGLGIVNFRWRTWLSPLSLFLLGFFVSLFLLRPQTPLDWLSEGVPYPHMKANDYFTQRGALAYLVHDALFKRANRQAIPTRSQVAATLEALKVKPAAMRFQPTPRRNVVFLLLESFIDAQMMSHAALDQSAYHPDFQRLLDRYGGRSALSPTAQGFTANAEMEMLCATPVLFSSVFFLEQIKNDAPCLPALLKAHGYRTFAFHPNPASYWNRGSVFKQLGFERFYAKDDFKLDDMDGRFLSDESLFRQVLQRLEKVESPFFAHVISLRGHHDYPLNERKRPKVIHSKTGEAVIERHANSVYYTSKAAADFIGKLHARWPDALVVLFGDHVPFYERDFQAFYKAGLFHEPFDSLSPEGLRRLFSMPVLIADPLAKKKPTAPVCFYELSLKVIETLDSRAKTWMHLFRFGEGVHVRFNPRFDNRHLVLDDAGGARICHDDEKTGYCKKVNRTKALWRILIRDIFSGNQHTFEALKAR